MVKLTGFDASQYPWGDPLEPVPSGRYTVDIVDSEWKTTKSGAGRYLQLCLEVREGECSGRLLWLRLNLENPNPSTVDVATKTLASVCRAVGVTVLDDSSQLHGIAFSVRVRRLQRPDTQELFNKIDRIAGVHAAAA